MREIGFSHIGGGFMAKLHSLAISSYQKYFFPPALIVRNECIVDSIPEIASEAAERFGYARCETDWHKVIDDPKTDVISICTPNDLHIEIALAAIAAGKHVYCEKPIAMNSEEARIMYEAAKKAGVVAAVGFNNRSIAAVKFLKSLIDKGEFGDIHSCQIRLIQSWGDADTPMQWRFDSKRSGSGAVGDTGSHIIDMILFLLGNITRVCSLSKTIVKERYINKSGVFVSKADRDIGITGEKSKVDVDDDSKSLMEFASGANGIFWTSRLATAHENTLDLEIYGDKGAARFSLEKPNEIEIYSCEDPADRRGFKSIKMGPLHPYGELWPMADLGVGYVEQKCSDFKHFFEAIAVNDPSLVSANFYDGYKTAVVIDSMMKSAKNGEWINVEE